MTLKCALCGDCVSGGESENGQKMGPLNSSLRSSWKLLAHLLGLLLGQLKVSHAVHDAQRDEEEPGEHYHAHGHGDVRLVHGREHGGRQPDEDLAGENVDAHELALLASGNDEAVEGALGGVDPAEAEAPQDAEDVGVALVVRVVHEDWGDGGDASPPDEGHHIALVGSDLLGELGEEDRSGNGADQAHEDEQRRLGGGELENVVAVSDGDGGEGVGGCDVGVGYS